VSSSDGRPAGPEHDPEPPVLKVKRDAEKEFRYHYDRVAREAMRRPRPEPRRGLFARLFRRGGRCRGRRRGLLPALLGVFALVLAVSLLPRGGATGHLAGYDVSLRAYAYQDALLASVAVTWKPHAREQVEEAPEVTVRFSTADREAGTVVSEPLGDGEATVRGRLPGTGRRVSAEIAIDGTTLKLTAPVGKP
jgi:hypothetical protein